MIKAFFVLLVFVLPKNVVDINTLHRFDLRRTFHFNCHLRGMGTSRRFLLDRLRCGALEWDSVNMACPGRLCWHVGARVHWTLKHLFSSILLFSLDQLVNPLWRQIILRLLLILQVHQGLFDIGFWILSVSLLFFYFLEMPFLLPSSLTCSMAIRWCLDSISYQLMLLV